jgi:threonine aldolase
MTHASFASDNNSGVHPRVMQALAEANAGHFPAYGNDPHTSRARELFAEHFGSQARVFFVYNGTGANAAALAALVQPWQAVICCASAHINVDECGAPERVTGAKLYLEPGRDGRIGPEAVDRHLHCLGFEHHSQPGAVSLTQATELGTVYSPDEVRAIARRAHAHGLAVHMDGARLANAAAALGCSPREASFDAGVDVLSFGGTKNGLMFGEAVVFADPERARAFPYIRKQATQLHSKMRFIAAQYTALLEDGLWLANAQNANAMARRLAEGAAALPGVRLSRPVQTNAVFATLPRPAAEALLRRQFFYIWDEPTCEARWVTSFDTTPADVDAFLADLAQALASAPGDAALPGACVSAT